MVSINFVPDVDKPTETYTAIFDGESGAYEIKNIPRGQYRVTVRQLDPYPKVDLLKRRYSLAKTPLRYEVTGNQVIDIDLPAATAKAR